MPHPLPAPVLLVVVFLLSRPAGSSLATILGMDLPACSPEGREVAVEVCSEWRCMPCCATVGHEFERDGVAG